MQATPQPTASKPAVFVAGDDNDDRAAILDLSNRYVFAEVHASRGMTARELAESAIAEYRRQTGVYPTSARIPPDATITPFGVFLEQYTARVGLCEESARLLPRTAMQYHSSTAAMTAARHGQLFTYLQAVTTLTAMGPEGAGAIDVLNERLNANSASESELLKASPAGTTLAGMMPLSIEQVAYRAAASAGVRDLPLNPQPMGHAASTADLPRRAWWALAEKIAPWWAKHSVAFLSGNAPQQTPSAFDCPGLSELETRQAIEALNGLQHLQRAVTSAQGPDVTLPDIVGYDDQWKSLFVLSLMCPHAEALTDAARSSAPLARSLRQRFAESRGKTAAPAERPPAALPEAAATKNRRRFAL